MNQNLLDNLNIRLGYKEQITLSRDEFNELLGNRDDVIDDLKEQILDLEGIEIYLKDRIKQLEKEVKILKGEK